MIQVNKYYPYNGFFNVTNKLENFIKDNWVVNLLDLTEIMISQIPTFDFSCALGYHRILWKPTKLTRPFTLSQLSLLLINCIFKSAYTASFSLI